MLARTLLVTAIAGMASSIAWAGSQQCPAETPGSLNVSAKGTRTALVCLAGSPVEMRYNAARRTIAVKRDGKQAVIARIDKGYTPELIGSVDYIRFLPSELQPYAPRGIVLLNIAERSTSGDGRGQCGSGEELFLAAVDVSRAPARLLGRVLVHSCREPVVLYETDGGANDYASFSVRDGRLAIKFLSLPGQREYPTALLSEDFRSLDAASDQAGR